LSVASLAIVVPAGWTEVVGAEPRELRSGNGGVLQVSQLAAQHLSYIASAPDLGAFAAEFGGRLGGAERTWGTASGARTGDCERGRFGLAVFSAGQFPSMLLWITVAADAAYMWTWLGPDPQGEEIRDALAIVMGAPA
jgi:hypothetical protein